MIAGFNEWAASANLGRVLSLEQLHHHRLGIEAEDYINTLVSNPPTREPLLPALGGLPFSLEETIKNHISVLEKHGIQPYFVFNGLNYNGQEDKLQASVKALKSITNAWDLYGASQPGEAVNEFGTLCTLDLDNVYRYVQTILTKLGVGFLVAPYSAAAQLAFINGTEFCDVIAGSSEVLMFEVDKLITKIDYDRAEFTFVTRKECVEALDCTSISMFIDVCLLAGSSFLPTLPALDEMSSVPKLPKIKAAAEMLKQRHMDANTLCMQFQQEDPNYLDRYHKAISSIKHHIIIRPDGAVVTLDAANAPFDVHGFMGQRLPDELFAYMSHGIIGSQVPQWRSSGQIVERPPLDGGESPVYHRLVKDNLTPLRATTVALLSRSLHHYYHKQDVTVSCWFDASESKLGSPNITDPTADIASWNVRLEQIGGRADELEQNLSELAFAMKSLEDTNFAKSSVTPKGKDFIPLTGTQEVRSNALWRFLQLRGYTNSDHTVSPLGQSLQAALAKTGDEDLEEPVIVALELLRLKGLNADDMFPYGGAPQGGSEIDKRNTLLVSRVACLANLRHKSIGFTGPLSRHLLGYRDMASVVRSSLRNMVEMSLTTMLLNGHVDREMSLDDLAMVSKDLPFLLDVDCALGVAVKSYLDELHARNEDPTAAEIREYTKMKAVGTWFPHAVDFVGDLERAWKLWDAVYAAVSIAPSNIVSTKDKRMWEEVNAWLADRK